MANAAQSHMDVVNRSPQGSRLFRNGQPPVSGTVKYSRILGLPHLLGWGLDWAFLLCHRCMKGPLPSGLSPGLHKPWGKPKETVMSNLESVVHRSVAVPLQPVPRGLRS